MSGKSYRYYLYKNRIRFKIGITHKLFLFLDTFFKHMRKYRILAFTFSKFFKKALYMFFFFKTQNTYSRNGLKHSYVNKIYKSGKVSMK